MDKMERKRRSPDVGKFEELKRLEVQQRKISEGLLETSIDSNTPRVVRVHPGARAFLLCRVQNLGTNSVMWFFGDQILSIDRYIFLPDARFSQTFERRTETWIMEIRKVRPNDEGDYTCKVTTKPSLKRVVTLEVIPRGFPLLPPKTMTSPKKNANRNRTTALGELRENVTALWGEMNEVKALLHQHIFPNHVEHHDDHHHDDHHHDDHHDDHHHGDYHHDDHHHEDHHHFHLAEHDTNNTSAHADHDDHHEVDNHPDDHDHDSYHHNHHHDYEHSSDSHHHHDNDHSPDHHHHDYDHGFSHHHHDHYHDSDHWHGDQDYGGDHHHHTYSNDTDHHHYHHDHGTDHPHDHHDHVTDHPHDHHDHGTDHHHEHEHHHDDHDEHHHEHDSKESNEVDDDNDHDNENETPKMGKCPKCQMMMMKKRKISGGDLHPDDSHPNDHDHGHYHHHHHHHHEPMMTAECVLTPNVEGAVSNITGRVIITQRRDGRGPLYFDISLHDVYIPEDGSGRIHGFHIHDRKIIDDKCSSAGPHFNPSNSTHGPPYSLIRHAGDLGNIKVDEQGHLHNYIISDDKVSFIGPKSIVNRSLVLHAFADDLGQGENEGSLKTGNAGPRLACCTIKAKSSAGAGFKPVIRFNG